MSVMQLCRMCAVKAGMHERKTPDRAGFGLHPAIQVDLMSLHDV